jgi:PTH1 family peptidyl-tRNA hydrolase
MTDGIAAIVGLGNPGAEYADTRHNAGFWFLDRIASPGSGLRLQSRFNAQVGELHLAGRRVWLLAPQTYMNRSGGAVAAFARYYRLQPGQLLVVHDDLDLAPGTVRLKRGGGDGGHNGLVDVTGKLGSPDYVRLRIGIGHPGSSRQVVSYVLRKPSPDERELIDGAIDRAAERIGDVVAGEYEKVMNVLHVKTADKDID